MSGARSHVTDAHTLPPLAPTQRDVDLVSWLRLIRSRRVGAVTFYRLMAEHGSAVSALEALPDVARAAGVKDYAVCDIATAERELDAGMRAGARLISVRCAEYPQVLKDIPDAPPLIWVRGGLEILNRPMVALVGARNASSLGGRMARKLAAELGAAGFVTVSGLARGVDTACHTASIETGTVAVMAGGADVIYPAENTKLAAQIAKQGAIVSELPPGLRPQARHFPRRNRIISGMARAVVVVEAAARSGSLITARNALDQGRDVLVVPGHPFDARAGGCNILIRDGATLVRSVDDILEAVGPAALPQAELPLVPKGPVERPRAQTRALHDQILHRLGPSPMAEDQLIRDLERPAGEVTSELVNLELDGRIERQSGGLIALKH